MITKVVKLPPHEQQVPFILTANQRMLLCPIGDIHFGAPGFPEDKLREHIEWALARDARFIGMGEFLDFASYSQLMQMKPLRDSTRQLIDEAIQQSADNLLKILASTKGRWLGLLEGDHRWDFQTGRSVDQYLCEYLDADFLGTSALIRVVPNGIKNRGADTLLYVHHGISSSRTQGGQLHRVEDLLKFIDADIYLMGHTHGKVAAPVDRLCLSPEGKVYHRTKILARTGGWLRGYVSHEPLSLDESVCESRGSYVEQRALAPSSLGGLCIGIGYELIGGSKKYYRPTIHLSV